MPCRGFCGFDACDPAGLGGVAVDAMENAQANGISKRMAVAARLVHDSLGSAGLTELQAHPSDTVRGWACFMIGQAAEITLASRLQMIQPLADDAHFGVREWAWMAVRPYIATDLSSAIALLVPWTAHPSQRVRRFATEATRPRGVWCAHIGALRLNPELALRLLEPLRADPAAYVQDSVGNWLNDASKDRPDWVQSLCAKWAMESPAQSTTRICKRALRSLDRAGRIGKER